MTSIAEGIRYLLERANEGNEVPKDTRHQTRWQNELTNLTKRWIN